MPRTNPTLSASHRLAQRFRAVRAAMGMLLTQRHMRVAGWELGWVLAGQAAAFVGSIIGVRVITESVSPEIYGRVAIALTASLLVGQVVLGPLRCACLRFFAPSQEGHSLGSFYQATLRLVIWSSAAVIAVGLIVSAGTGMLLGAEWALLCLAAVILSLIAGWVGILDGIQNGARQRVVVAWHQSLGQWLRPAAVALLIVPLGSTSVAVIVAQIVASVAVLVSQGMFFISLYKQHSDKAMVNHPLTRGQPYRDAACDTSDDRKPPEQRPHCGNLLGGQASPIYRQMLTYALPFGSWGIFTWIQGSADRWALQTFANLEQVGLYTVVCALGLYPVSMVGAIIVQFAEPIMYSRAGKAGDYRQLQSAVRLCVGCAGVMVTVTGLLTIAAMIFHEPAFSLLVAPRYRGASHLFPLPILVGGLSQVGQLVSLIPMSLANSRALVVPKISTAIIGVVLSLAGSYLFGMVGVFIAGIAFTAAYAGWLVILSIRLVASCSPKAQGRSSIGVQC